MGADHQRQDAAPGARARAGCAGEAQRVQELRRLGILDSPPEESFERTARLAARTLHVPIVAIGLVDEQREWLKARIGLEAAQLDRDASIAALAIAARQALVIADATRDPRLAANPLVTGAPHVRACVSVPFHTRGGLPIGALTVMDTQPRTFAPDEISACGDLTGIIQDMVHAREVVVEGEWLLRAAKDSEQRHTEIERRLQRIADSIPALIGYWNTELRCEFANDKYRVYSGLTPQQMIGLHFREVLGDKLFELNGPHAYAALAGEPQRFQRSMPGPDGMMRDTEGQYLPDRDENGVVRGFFVLVTDVTELTAAKGALELSNAKLLKESTTDFLTGLANRRVFTERCEAAATLARTSGEGYGLILLDLDDFKQINDSLGHDNGDRVLQAVGEILGSQLRERDDLAARLGGEEFAILCPGDFTEEKLQEMAGRIRNQINRTTVQTPRGPVRFTASFGLAHSQAGDTCWAEAFTRADAALYEAKEAGKDRVVFGRSAAKATTGRFRSMGIPPTR